MRIDGSLVERLYREANADRWSVSERAFANALETSCRKKFSGDDASPREVSRYLSSLHLEDLALACACAEGHEGAWDQFVLAVRPALYRAAAALDPAGGARELADTLYGDLYGLDDRSGERRSLFRYFHGRSSLATWLRAVLAQRHVDRVREARRTEPLPEDLPGPPAPSMVEDPECPRLVDRLRSALGRALARLAPRTRLRLVCYYVETMTLVETGRLLKEHEATVSRQIRRTQRAIRIDVERELRAEGLNEAQVQRCFECATEGAGGIDVAGMLKARSG